MNIDEALDIAIKKYAKGKTVLDLGGYSGRECEIAMKAGAKSTVCVDDGSWKTYDNWAKFTPFEDVNYVNDNFMNYKEAADIVILKNVIYHQRNPWACLEHVRKLTKEMLLLTTSYVEGEAPVWRIYKPYEGHPVSWTVAWRPTHLGLVKLLEATGFENIKILTDEGAAIALSADPVELPIGFGERP